MRYTNWNPYTADEPDPNPGMRDDAIDDCAEKYMADAAWIKKQLDDGYVNSKELCEFIAGTYEPERTHATIGRVVIDILWKLATKQAEQDVDSGEYEAWRYEP